MDTVHYNHIQFLKSAHEINQFPSDRGAEVAFAGRSNTGKSSALNAITGFQRLARTSKTPGRTQLINFFQIDAQRRLVDLPGYGYAKVPDAVKVHWEKLISSYLAQRQSLTGVILMIDSRHSLKPLDWQMIKWTVFHQLPIHILLTKADKLKRAAAQQALLELSKALSGYEDWVSAQLFSAFSGHGMMEIKEKLDQWLQS